jgi:hypothetical protein
MIKYIVIATIGIVVLWVFWAKQQDEVKAVALNQVTPEQRFDTLFASEPVPVDQLAEFCEKYPDLAQKYVPNRQFRIAGQIQDFILTGMDDRRAEITLHTGTRRHWVVIYDLDHYVNLRVYHPQAGRFGIVDTELFWMSSSDATSQRLRLFEKDTRLEQTVTLLRVGPSTVLFTALLDTPLHM